MLERSDWRRITARRRGEIAGEVVRVCEAAERGIAEAWQRRDPHSPRLVVGYLHASPAADRATTAPGSPPPMALTELLIGLPERVPVSEAQIARATLADPTTVQAWLRRREAPAGLEAQRLTELVAFVEEMACNIRGDAVPEWLDRDIPFLDDGNPRRARRRRLRAADPARARAHPQHLHAGTAGSFIAGAIFHQGCI
ncbi:MAG: hypothetical protein ACJ780_18885 [Solirubrobacteraceae bacterium]